MRTWLVAAVLGLGFPLLSLAQSPLAPGKLYRAAAIAESGPEPARSYCQLLMSAYARVAGEHQFDYIVLLRTTQDVNAFATITHKGERLLIFTPRLINGLKQDEAALASIIGHEIGHHVRGHTTAGQERQKVVSVVSTIAGAIVDYQLSKRGNASTGIGREAGGTVGRLVIMKFSRDQEREADAYGLQAMAKAGYDPAGALRAQEKFLKAFGNGTGSLMESHPPSRERIDNLLAQIKADPAMLVAAQRASAERADGPK